MSRKQEAGSRDVRPSTCHLFFVLLKQHALRTNDTIGVIGYYRRVHGDMEIEKLTECN